MDYEGRTFENETVRLDDNTFTDCVFRDCIIEYGGGAFTLTGTFTFDGDWRIRFHSEATNTARLLLFVAGKLGVGFGNHFEVDIPRAGDFN